MHSEGTYKINDTYRLKVEQDPHAEDPREWRFESMVDDIVQRWKDGEVYVVTEQIKRVYVNREDPNDLVELWVDGESLGGCYLEPGYSAEDVARCHFPDYPECPECDTPDSETQGEYRHKNTCSLKGE